MTSSPGFIRPRMVAAIASVHPEVTVISVSGSIVIPVSFWNREAMAELRSGIP